MTPTTEAGKRSVSPLMTAFVSRANPGRQNMDEAQKWATDAILAIEAQAAAAALQAARERIEGLPVHYRRNGFASSTAWVTRRAVLAALERPL